MYLAIHKNYAKLFAIQKLAFCSQSVTIVTVLPHDLYRKKGMVYGGVVAGV